MRVIELFAGAGGLALGTKLAGHHHVLLVERDKHACGTLRRNGMGPVLAADVRGINFSDWRGEADLICGGVPCQPFSGGGKARGANDERDMFPEMLRALSEIRPQAFVIENVKGLARPRFASYLKDILLSTHQLGYGVRHGVLNAADFGVPQLRERLIFIGVMGVANDNVPWPTPTHGDGKRPWITLGEALCGLPNPASPHAIDNHEPRNGGKAYKGHTGSQLDKPSKAIKAGVHGVPGGENMIAFPDGSVRYMTAREAARIQCFPDTYAFEGSWSECMRQIGNAVPVRLAETIMQCLATL